MPENPSHPIAQRLSELFAGHSGAHGTHGVPVLDARNGLKWEIKSTARTLREPATLEMWQDHIEGKRPLGVIPIQEDSTCVWGSIDIDVYDADLSGVQRRVREAKLPLVPCRSKSGGLHLFLFLEDAQPAGVVRDTLRDIAARLGIAKKANGTTDTEVFPVQSEVLTERNDVGNWMVMPYFGSTYDGKLREQVGLKDNGSEMTVLEFLKVAEAARVSAQGLIDLGQRRGLGPPKKGSSAGKANGKGPAELPFSDGPVCLQHMVADGGRLQDGRKRTLFMMGLYYKRADPANWRGQVEAANHLFFEPPLPAEEVVGVTRSLAKKDYEYTCKVEPMAAHCDARACQRRKFGVGQGGAYPIISSLAKLDTDPPIWFLEVDGMRYEATTEQLMNYGAMTLLFAARGNRVFRLMKQTDWNDSLIDPMQEVNVLPAPPDAGAQGRFHELLEDFLVNRWRGEAKEDLLRGKPWEDIEGNISSPRGTPKHYFRLRNLQDFIERQGLRGLSRPQVVRQIQMLDGGSHQFNIKGTNLWCWWVPSDAVQSTPQLDAPLSKGEPI